MINRKGFTLLAICSVFFLVSCASGRSKSTPTPMPQIVNTEKIIFTVERGSLISQREVTGEIVPEQQDELFFRASGYISRVLVKNGDYFNKGDILAELQQEDLLDQLQQARIDLEVSQDNFENEKLQRAYNIQQAESNVNISQKQVELAEHLLESAMYNQKEEAQINLDIATEKLKSAQAYRDLIQGEVNTDTEKVVKRNQLTLDRLERMVTERQLIAPYDGIVLYIGLIPGTQAEAYSSGALIGDPAKLITQVTYDYELVNTVDSSTEVYLYLTKNKDHLYQVKYIPDFLPISSKKEGITIKGDNISMNYLYFSVPEDLPLDQIPAGSRVYLQVVIGNEQDVLLLPPPAIRGNDEFKYVIVLEDDYHRRVEVVHIGLKTNDKWEIVANLNEGDLILGP